MLEPMQIVRTERNDAAVTQRRAQSEGDRAFETIGAVERTRRPLGRPRRAPGFIAVPSSFLLTRDTAGPSAPGRDAPD